MSILILVLLFTLISADTYVRTFAGQPYSLTNIHSLDITPTSHEYILFGHVISSFAMLKLSNTSEVQWCYKFSGNGSDAATAAIISGTNSFIIVGRTNSFASTWIQSAMILKIYFNGTFAWSFAFDNTYSSAFNDIKPTSDDGFIAVGHHYLPVFKSDVFAIKFAANGAREWIYSYDSAEDERAQSVVVNTDSSYVILGTNGVNLMLIKLTTTGQVSWVHKTTSDYISPSSVIRATDGTFLVVGWIYNYTQAHADALVYKISAAGARLWSISLGSTDTDGLNCAAAISDGSYIVAGQMMVNSINRALFARISSTGQLLWSKTYFMPSVSTSINAIHIDGDYIVMAGNLGTSSFIIRATLDGYVDGACNTNSINIPAQMVSIASGVGNANQMGPYTLSAHNLNQMTQSETKITIASVCPVAHVSSFESDLTSKQSSSEIPLDSSIVDSSLNQGSDSSFDEGSDKKLQSSDNTESSLLIKSQLSSEQEDISPVVSSIVRSDESLDRRSDLMSSNDMNMSPLPSESDDISSIARPDFISSHDSSGADLDQESDSSRQISSALYSSSMIKSAADVGQISSNNDITHSSSIDYVSDESLDRRSDSSSDRRSDSRSDRRSDQGSVLQSSNLQSSSTQSSNFNPVAKNSYIQYWALGIAAGCILACLIGVIVWLLIRKKIRKSEDVELSG